MLSPEWGNTLKGFNEFAERSKELAANQLNEQVRFSTAYSRLKGGGHE